MSYKQLKEKTEGFTIIEVLIVLAIAGLIMLIVFLAVPQLRRSQQNTQIRNEASRILTAATEFESNSNGAQVSSTTVASVYTSAGPYKQLTTSTAFGGSGAVAGGASRLVVGTCNGTTATAATGRTYALQFALADGVTQACIQS